jgi:hypothetical protein
MKVLYHLLGHQVMVEEKRKEEKLNVKKEEQKEEKEEQRKENLAKEDNYLARALILRLFL